MYPPAFDYVRAGSVEEAVSQITERDGKLLAGGHSLLPVMKMRLADPGVLILDTEASFSVAGGSYPLGERSPRRAGQATRPPTQMSTHYCK